MTEGKIWAAAEWRACPDHHSSQASLDALLEKQCLERDFGRQCRCPVQNDGMTGWRDDVCFVCAENTKNTQKTNKFWDELLMLWIWKMHCQCIDLIRWTNAGWMAGEVCAVPAGSHWYLHRDASSPGSAWVSVLTAFAWVHDSLNSREVSPRSEVSSFS